MCIVLRSPNGANPTTIKFTEGFVYMFIRPLLQQNQSKTLHHTLHANRTHTDECQQVLFKPSQLKGNMHPCIVFLSILHSQASPSWHLLLLRMRVYEGDTCRFFRASQANVTRAVTSPFGLQPFRRASKCVVSAYRASPFGLGG
jgi:hypothetical protein